MLIVGKGLPFLSRQARRSRCRSARSGKTQHCGNHVKVSGIFARRVQALKSKLQLLPSTRWRPRFERTTWRLHVGPRISADHAPSRRGVASAVVNARKAQPCPRRRGKHPAFEGVLILSKPHHTHTDTSLRARCTLHHAAELCANAAGPRDFDTKAWSLGTNSGQP